MRGIETFYMLRVMRNRVVRDRVMRGPPVFGNTCDGVQNTVTKNF